MCVSADFSDVKVASRDMIIYKVCRAGIYGHFVSMHHPGRRIHQIGGFNIIGGIKEYKVGEETESPLGETPGIYCYRKRGNEAKGYLGHSNLIVIKIRVKKGTRYVKGVYYGRETINAEKVLVMGPA